MDLIEAEVRQEVEKVVNLTDLGAPVQLDETMPVFERLMFVLAIFHAKLYDIVQNS